MRPTERPSTAVGPSDRNTVTRLAVLAAVLLGTLLLCGSARSAPAETFPWPRTPLCGAAAQGRVVVAARLAPGEVRYALASPRSLVLGFTLDSFDARGGSVGHGGPNLLGSDRYAGRAPRLGAERRWQVAVISRLRIGGRTCRAGAVRVLSSRGANQLWRCSGRGTRFSRVLKCRLQRAPHPRRVRSARQ